MKQMIQDRWDERKDFLVVDVVSKTLLMAMLSLMLVKVDVSLV